MAHLPINGKPFEVISRYTCDPSETNRDLMIRGSRWWSIRQRPLK